MTSSGPSKASGGRQVVLGVESTFNNCCVCVLDQDGAVWYEAGVTFRAPAGLVQDTTAWRHSLTLFHAETLPKLLSDAVRSLPPGQSVSVVALAVVAGRRNANVEVARTAVGGLSLPVVEVDHYEAHLLAGLLCRPAPVFPYVGLTIAGGHCHLQLARAFGDYVLLGSHEVAPRNRFGHGRAPGSVLDRCSELLGLVPPGQPDGAIEIDRVSAMRADWRYQGFPVTEELNRNNGYDVDFHALYEEVMGRIADRQVADRTSLAVSVQECVMSILLDKAFAAAKSYAAPRIVFGGGVASNSRLRRLAADRAAAESAAMFFPPHELCVDNARMIAFAALLGLNEGAAAPGQGG